LPLRNLLMPESKEWREEQMANQGGSPARGEVKRWKNNHRRGHKT